MSAPAMVYLVISLATAYLVSRRASQRYAIFVISVWLLCGPIIDGDEVSDIVRKLAIHFNTTWLVLGLLLPFVAKRLILGGASGWPQGASRGLLAWTIAYCLAAMVALAYNVPSIGQRYAFHTATEFLLLALLTWLACDVSDQRNRRALYTAVVVFACYSAVVGIVQSVADDSFLRVTVADPLPSGITRAKGLFRELQSQGLVLSIAAAIVLLTWRRAVVKIVLTALLGAGVLLAFMRIGWICFAVVVLSCLALTKSLRLAVGFLVTIAVATWLVLTMTPTYTLKEVGSDRSSLKTIAGRIELLRFGLTIVGEHPLGIGDYFMSPEYARAAVRHGFDLYEGQAYTRARVHEVPVPIHNGFLGSAVKYGYAGGLCFLGLCIQAVIVFARELRRGGPLPAVGMLVVVVFVISNISQENSFPYLPLLLFCLLVGVNVGRVQDRCLEEHLVPFRSSEAPSDG
jgi:hypothetical protein